jgi:hypothetical protein
MHKDECKGGRQMTREEAARVLQEFYDFNKTLTPHNDLWLQSDITINRYTQEELGKALPAAIAALRGWVKTADRLPEGDEHDEILGLYKGLDYLLYDIVQIGWLRLHPEMYVYWTHLPKKPEVEG